MVTAEQMKRGIGAVIDGEEITVDQLQAVFGLLHNPDDWKAPIDCEVMANDKQKKLIAEAINFMTATDAEFEVLEPSINKYRVTSIGYRNGPAGP